MCLCMGESGIKQTGQRERLAVRQSVPNFEENGKRGIQKCVTEYVRRGYSLMTSNRVSANEERE